jgi:hypothetical protein
LVSCLQKPVLLPNMCAVRRKTYNLLCKPSSKLQMIIILLHILMSLI